MTKPWEEAWEADTCATPHVLKAGTMEEVIDHGPDAYASSTYESRNRERAAAALMACAPEMARMLLALEFAAGTHRVLCPACSEESHRPDCPLEALLRKAGVR